MFITGIKNKFGGFVLCGNFTDNMAKEVKKEKIPNFSTRIEIRDESAKIIREGLDAKMKKERRKTYTATIEAILLDYFQPQ